MKTIQQHFSDWEAEAFGYGYGTGEEHTLAALKLFFDALGRDGGDNPNSYDYRRLEQALGPAVAWLMINALCREEIIDYGTSPRGGWLSPEGERLKAFVQAHTVDQLVEFCCADTSPDEYHRCCSDSCCCEFDTKGQRMGNVCPNPFWPRRQR